MPVIINASPTSGLVISNDMSGTLQFQNNGVNLPMSGLAPAFSAYQSSAQTISFGTGTKVQLQTEEFDTNSNFDSTTNYRFTPTVAGYYLIIGSVTAAVSGGTYSQSSIWKNGTGIAGSLQNVNAGPYTNFNAQKLVYMNGSTDYVELYFVSIGSGTFLVSTGVSNTFLQGFLARGV